MFTKTCNGCSDQYESASGKTSLCPDCRPSKKKKLKKKPKLHGVQKHCGKQPLKVIPTRRHNEELMGKLERAIQLLTQAGDKLGLVARREKLERILKALETVEREVDFRIHDHFMTIMYLEQLCREYELYAMNSVQVKLVCHEVL